MRIFATRFWATCFSALARLEIIGWTPVALSETKQDRASPCEPQVAVVDFIRHSQDETTNTPCRVFFLRRMHYGIKNAAQADARVRNDRNAVDASAQHLAVLTVFVV